MAQVMSAFKQVEGLVFALFERHAAENDRDRVLDAFKAAITPYYLLSIGEEHNRLMQHIAVDLSDVYDAMIQDADQTGAREFLVRRCIRRAVRELSDNNEASG